MHSNIILKPKLFPTELHYDERNINDVFRHGSATFSHNSAIDATRTHQQLERNMTNITSKILFSTFAISTIAGIAMLAQTSGAAARSVTSCEGSSRQSVVECCEVLVQRKGMPLWMKQTGRNCSSAAKCVSTGGGRNPTYGATVAPAKPKLCKIVRINTDDREGGGDGGRDNPGKGGRDNPNGGNTDTSNPNGRPN